MKPRSIISLIIAAVFVLGGIITCIVATVMANADGVMLFPEADSNGNLVYRMELGTVSKINVDAVDADVIIKGGAEKSSIEVVNFNANYYKLTNSNGSVNFAQVDDFMSMFKFWDNGFSFKGMRYILRFGDDAAGGKRVIINLADDLDIRLVNLYTESGTVSLENLVFSADYTLKSLSGTINMSGVSDASSVSLYGDSTKVVVQDVTTGKLNVIGDALMTSFTSVTSTEGIIDTANGNVTLKDSSVDKLSVSTISGNVELSPVSSVETAITTESGSVTLDIDSIDSLDANVVTANGKISVNDSFKDAFALTTTGATRKLNVTTIGGDVYITLP